MFHLLLRLPRCFATLWLFAVLLTGCLNKATVEVIRAGEPVAAPPSFDHSEFTVLLADHVDVEGLVNYVGLQSDSVHLDRYLAGLAVTEPANLPPADALAFWMNAYNAYTLKLVIDNYPVESILKTVSGPFIPSVNSPFSVEFATVGGTVYSLDGIEHGIIREQFDEPRIHFALVCGALSCPPLRAEAYDGAVLDAQLDDQARRFLHDPSKNAVTVTEARLSKLFDWYEGDLGGSKPGVLSFIAPYFDGDVRAALEAGTPSVSYNDYEWSLNER